MKANRPYCFIAYKPQDDQQPLEMFIYFFGVLCLVYGVLAMVFGVWCFVMRVAGFGPRGSRFDLLTISESQRLLIMHCLFDRSLIFKPLQIPAMLL
jgi:hypothetical protein